MSNEDEKELVFLIREDGSMKTIYTEDIDLSELGFADSRNRASEVEQEVVENGQLKWVVRLLQPVTSQGMTYPTGYVIAVDEKRSEAIRKEIKWLQLHAIEFGEGT